MKTKDISLEDAIFMIEKNESHFFDHKSIAVNGAKVQKICVAFANADGGEFVIGIKDIKEEPDTNKRWEANHKVEDFNSHLQAISEIIPTLDFSCTFLNSTEFSGLVMLVRVDKSSVVHRTAKNEVYQRKGAQSLKLVDEQKTLELQFAKGATSFEDFITPSVPAEFIVESKKLKDFLKDFSPKTDPLEYVLNENLIDPKTFDPRVGSLVLFAENPSAVMPRKCAVKIARYETKEDDPDREHLAKTYTIEGCIYDLVHKTVEKITEIMSSVQVWSSEGLKKLEYPPEAIWEIITNAIIHRDYSISDDVHVYIFNNRIEVLSPGKLPGYVTVENILDARFSRNHKIVRTLNRYRNAPNKDLGEGLNTAFEKMKEWKLKPPIIEEEGNYVKVTIPHISLAQPTEQIIEFLKNHNSINNSQARDITGIKSENLVKVEFYKLRDEGLIERIPELKGPASAWRLTNAGKQKT